jgi:hypothetical protein
MKTDMQKNACINWWKLAMMKTASSLRGQWWVVDGVAHRAGHDNMPVHGRWAEDMAEREIAPAEMDVIRSHAKEMEALGISMDDARARKLSGSPLWMLEHHVMDMGRTDEDRMDAEEIQKIRSTDDQRRLLVGRMMDEAREQIPKELWRAAHSGSGNDASAWLMNRGGVAVSGNNIRMGSISHDSMIRVAKAMDETFDDIEGESTVNIDVGTESVSRHFSGVPWAILRIGDMNRLATYRD